MSTRLTQSGVQMVDSRALKLVFGAAGVSEQITQYLSISLINKGFESITPSTLSFLGTLECGINYGSEIARNMNVSRQMVAKNVKALCQLGYLEQCDGAGKQKQILFTQRGELLMAEARKELLEMDGKISRVVGKTTLNKTIINLNEIQEVLNGLLYSSAKE